MSFTNDEFDCWCHRKRKYDKPFDPISLYMKKYHEKYGSDWEHNEDCDKCNQSWKNFKCHCHKKRDCDCDCHEKHDCNCHKKDREKCDGCVCKILKHTGIGVEVKVVTDSGQVIFGKFFGFDRDCCVKIKQNAAVCVDTVKVQSGSPAPDGEIVFIDCRKIESVSFIS